MPAGDAVSSVIDVLSARPGRMLRAAVTGTLVMLAGRSPGPGAGKLRRVLGRCYEPAAILALACAAVGGAGAKS